MFERHRPSSPSFDRDRCARIAILGLMLESNRFAPVTTRKDFEERHLLSGDQILNHPQFQGMHLHGRHLLSGDQILRHPQFSGSLAARGRDGFGKRMSQLRNWEPVPILLAMGDAGGPCDHGFFEWFLEEMKRRLKAAGPVDAVYIMGHGAGTTTLLDDMDGPYFAAVRQEVGPFVPIVATLDLHGNISEEMVASADILISQLTNPHVDDLERQEEAAEHIDQLLAGVRSSTAFIRLPLVTPQVTQLTKPGHPYGDLIRLGQQRCVGSVMNVSILSGFAFSDTVHNGLAIVVTTRDEPGAARDLALALAEKAWADRHRYRPNLIDLRRAIELARAAGKAEDMPRIVLADVADNPGGGGTCNTTSLLASLVAANIEDVQFGMFFDPATVSDAWQAGVGGRFDALFNRGATHHLASPFVHSARVMSLSEGRFVGTEGISKGVYLEMGRSCLLQVGGVSVAVTSIRHQITGIEHFEHFGLDRHAAKVFVVKSRGHFRAGFEPFVPPERIFEVDVPGLTTPNLGSVPWSGLSRPSYPLHPETEWHAT